MLMLVNVNAATRTWDGGGGDNNWSTCANWSTDTCPVSVDTVIFDNNSDKDSSINAGFAGTITTLNILSGYDGTITMERSFATTTFNMASGSFTAANQTLDINGGFTLSGGNFTSSSSTTTLAGALTVSGSPVFTHNSGTFTFDGTSSVTLSCGNITFNLVIFANTSGAKTVSSNCNFPLGNNPSVGTSGGDIAIGGTLTGTGTIGFSDVVTLNSNAALTGFSGLTADDLTVSGATIDLSSLTTTFVITNTTNVSSGTITFPNNADFNGTFNFSGGTINAPAGNMFFANAFTVTNTPTFNHNNGTVVFDGAAIATLSCGGFTFNQVSFQHSSGTKTVSSNCNLPLGNSPTIGSSTNGGFVTVNGTISGTGTLTMNGTSTTLVFNSGSSISGFSGYVMRNLTVSGGTVDLSGATTFAASSTVTLSSGSLSLPSSSDLNGALIISGGTFTAPSSSLNLAGALTISGTPTFNHNSGSFIFDGTSSATLSCNNVSFNTVSFAHTSNTKTISSNCIMPVGNNPIFLTGHITVNGTLSGSGTIASGGNLTFNSGSAFIGFSGINTTGTFSNTGIDIDLTGFNPVNMGSLSLSGGSLTAPSGTMTLSSNFFRPGGTFNHNNGTILITGTFSSISGTSTFYNLTRIIDSANSLLTLPASATQTILGALTLQGTSDNHLTVRSSTESTQALIDPQGTVSTAYLSVRDINNLDDSAIYAVSNTDLGNNTNWIFEGIPSSDPASEPVYSQDFETGIPAEDWTSTGDAIWTQSSTYAIDGTNSIASGIITDSQSSILTGEVTVDSDSNLRFDWRASSEQGWDYGIFCLDNEACDEETGYTRRISGETDWQIVRLDLPVGSHTLTWKYIKDSGSSEGDDRVYVDNFSVWADGEEDDEEEEGEPEPEPTPTPTPEPSEESSSGSGWQNIWFSNDKTNGDTEVLNEEPLDLFKDISSKHIFYGYISNLKEMGIVNGYKDGSYKADTDITRGQMSKFIRKGLSLDTKLNCNSFLDIKPDNTFYEDIQTLKCHGVVDGYSDGNFYSEYPVTRGEAMKFIVQGSRIKLNDETFLNNLGVENIFPDITEENIFTEYIVSGYANGIINGYEDGEFKSEIYLSRGQMAKMIYKTRIKLSES